MLGAYTVKYISDHVITILFSALSHSALYISITIQNNAKLIFIVGNTNSLA